MQQISTPRTLFELFLSDNQLMENNDKENEF